MKKYFLVVIFLSFLPFIGSAQNTELDSLKSVLQASGEDTIRVNTLIAISSILYSTDPSDAIVYGNLARNLAQKINYPEGEAYALKNIGLGHYMQGNYNETLDDWLASLAVFKAIKDTMGISNLNNNLGTIYFNQGDDAKAAEYFLRSLQLAEDIDDKLRIVTALQNVGAVYLNKPETFEKALPYYWKALPLSEEVGDREAMGFIAVNLGEIHLELGNYDSSLFYLEKSLNSGEEEYYYQSHTLNTIGKVYNQKKDYPQALKYQQNAIETALKLDQKLEVAQAQVSLADSYKEIGNISKALKTYKNAMTVAKEIEANYELKDVYLGMADAYAKQSDYRNAYRFFKLFNTIKDTIYNIETDDKIKGLQFSYEMDKKQDQIDLLEKNAEIERLETKRQKAISIGAIIFGIMLLVLAGGLFNRYKYIRRTKRIIEEEKDRSEGLLLNILPAETAEELKQNGEAKARKYEMVTILFTDFKGFTKIASQLSPETLVQEIHECYKAFDEIVTLHHVEKIKTIGDAYMAAGGLPVSNTTNPTDVAMAALDICHYMEQLKENRIKEGRPYFEIRIGIHTGPIVAGIVGIKKFAYDIWGDTVNIASRMESNSEPGKINISEVTYKLVKDKFECTPRGQINVKGGGDRHMYFLKGIKAAYLKVKEQI